MKSASSLAIFSFTFVRVAVLLAMLVLAVPYSRAQLVSNIFSFNEDNGAFPTLHFFNPADGKFYGSAFHGGNTTSSASNGLGTLFRVSTSGVFETIAEFEDDTNYADGGNPDSLVLASDGNFYGTTSGLESTNNYGTIFRVASSDLELQTLYEHTDTNYGEWPQSLVAVGAADDVMLFGLLNPFTNSTTTNNGRIFGISTNFTEEPAYIHEFVFETNSMPVALIAGSSGFLYGLTKSASTNLFGAIFRCQADTNDAQFTNIFLFKRTNGWDPKSLLQGPDGNLYGTAKADDSDPSGLNGFATVFRIATNGTGFTTLAKFRKTNSIGVDPPDLYITAISNGFIYGTFDAIHDDNYNLVAPSGVFRVALDGAGFTVLRSIDAAGDADATALLVGPGGRLYGSSDYGGAYEFGSIFNDAPPQKRSQTITFKPAATQKFKKGRKFTLSATATSKLSVSFKSSNSKILSISGRTATIRGKGKVTVTASQRGNANYLPAKAVSRTITIR